MLYARLTDCTNARECEKGKDAEVDVPLERLLYEYGPREEVDLKCPDEKPLNIWRSRFPPSTHRDLGKHVEYH